MPPKNQYTKEKIVEAALAVVREEGMEALNARKVAESLGGSTQPIYSFYGSMDELKTDLVEAAYQVVLEYMRAGTDQESSFLALGLGYLEFARSEPQLFRFLFLSGSSKWSFLGDESPLFGLTDKMREDFPLSGMPEEVLKQLLKDMSIYTHGICALSHINEFPLSREEERKMLHDMGGRLIAMAFIMREKPDVLAEWAGHFEEEHN